MTTPAIVLCPNAFRLADGKTAHGLVRGSERFRIKAVVDASCAGRDAGELLDGRHRDIPMFADLASALAGAGPGIVTAIIGMATHGGRLNDALLALLENCIEQGLDIVNGLHESVSSHSRLGPLARAHGIKVTDLRTPPPLQALHFWEGHIAGVQTPRIAVLGTDCSVGKRTTARALTLGLCQRGLGAEIALIHMYGSRVIGIALSEEASDPDAMLAYQREHARQLGLPVVRPAVEGVGALVDALERWMTLPAGALGWTSGGRFSSS